MNEPHLDRPTYEVYVKPANGPVIVGERDDAGYWCWVTADEAIAVARTKKARHPHMDFIVHSVINRNRAKVFDTTDTTNNNPIEGNHHG